MTEPIIINGVDVSECDFRTLENICRVGIVCFCNEFPNCYYKQFKRTQQELQQAMDNYVKATNYYEDKLAQIKRIINEVENER